MPVTFKALRVEGDNGSPDIWLIVDRMYDLHRVASNFCMSLTSAKKSLNTVRTYAPKVAHFLTWCSSNAIRWERVTFAQLGRYGRFVRDTPMQNGHLRSAETVNLYIVAVTEFLRWAHLQGLVSPKLLQQIAQPKHLRYMPTGFDPGEQGQFRIISKNNLKLPVNEGAVAFLEPEQADAVLAACLNPRDLFLIRVMHDGGLRIGEALGLHREDIHFLPSSKSLGCDTSGPHMHVKRRMNANGSYAKSPHPRIVPVSTLTTHAYREYLFMKEELAGNSRSDFVFLNLFGENPDTPMKYRNAKRCTDRIAKAAGTQFTPHLLRHTAATAWFRNGASRDVVQNLLGHVSAASTQIYIHTSEAEKRNAVDGVRISGDEHS